MSGKIYFQWQNEFLRNTIYPLRERKLRDFLLYYKEIDLWREYRDKKIRDLPNEAKALVEAENKAIAEMHKAEKEERDYFCNPEVPPLPDGQDNEHVESLHNSLTNLHKDFQTYFGEYKKKFDRAPEKDKQQSERSLDRNEKIYIVMRIAEWEIKLKELNHQITRKTNLLAAVQHEDKRTEKAKEVEILKNTVLCQLEKELGRLRAFASAKNRLVERKEEFDRRQQDNTKKLKKIPDKLAQIEKEIESLEARKASTTREIARLTAALNLNEFLREWSSTDIYDEIRQALMRGRVPLQNFVVDIVVEAVGAAIEKAGGDFRKDLGLKLKGLLEGGEQTQQISDWIREQTARVKQALQELDEQVAALEARAEAMPLGSPNRMNQLLARNILGGPALKSILTREADKLEDLLKAMEYSRDHPAKLQARLAREQTSLATLDRDLQKKNTEKLQFDNDLASAAAALRVPREKFLTGFVPDNGELSVKKDIMPFKARQYYEELENLDHDQLLRRVYERFHKEPDRFPLWLQYMVVHFSGMRYASAHGSWADPRDLLLSLSMLRIQQEHKALTDNDIRTQCEGKLLIYDTATKGTKGARNGAALPALARAAANGSTDPATPNPVREKIDDYYLPRLDPQKSLDTRRKALLDLKIDEENYEIREMESEDVLEQLKALRRTLKLPDSMWNEIVKLTDLRLTEIDREDWETFKPEDQEKRVAGMESKLAKYREILNNWKKENLTGWREEHERSNRLIVTRAVCNEVAEHIQHLRGHKAAAGLAEKPFWYRNAQSKFYETNPRPAEQPPYFVRAKDRNDFEIGASLLWLRFVHDVPNQWREARPIETRRGEGLISSEYLGRKRESGGWVYTLSQPISRTRQKITSSKKGAKPAGMETQWLRWMHEATVAAVEETAEGTVVLTFETALPYDDPSMATVGVFKRYLSDLTWDLGEDAYNPAFVGFVPERALPPKEWADIEEMLDWNHILLDDVISPAELAAYREKYIRNWKPPRPTIQVVDESEAELKKGKAHLPIDKFVEWTDELASDPNNNLWKVRIWGEPAMKEKYSVRIFEGRDYGSNFQAVGLWNSAEGRGAVAYHITIGREDIDRLMAMQIEDEYQAKRTGKGDWRKQKMDWLCKGEGTVFFTKEGPGWKTAETIMWGTVAIGGNLVQVERFEDVAFKTAEGWQKKKMARLVGFRRRDWGRPLEELLAEGLVHRCFCAMEHDRPADTPKGIIYSPFLSVQESAWKFAGTARPQALYLPVEELVKPCHDGYFGVLEMLDKIQQERKKKDQKKRKPKP